MSITPWPHLSLLSQDTETGQLEPMSDQNLVHKAMALLQAKLGKVLLFKLILRKSIPAGAGLGGGSSNAATALLACNWLLGHPLTKETLLELGLHLGCDVPFFLGRHSGVMEGVGEKLTPWNFNNMWYFLAWPGPLATAKVFDALSLTSAKAPLDHRDLTAYLPGSNDLLLPALASCKPLQVLKKALEDQTSRECFMTGSGSTLFVPFATARRARQFQSNFNKRYSYPNWVVRSCQQVPLLQSRVGNLDPLSSRLGEA